MKTEALIHLKDVGVDFPIYNAASMSLKNRLLSSVTGGTIDREHDGVGVVRGLQDINLRITAGERVGLIGHNGAGKTTMLRVLSGIYHPTQGEALIQGDVVSLIDISLGIDPEATGRENIRLRSAMLGFTPEQTRERMDEIIDFSGLGDFIEMPFRTYSTGMQLRLAFAVSTTVSPQILIMDEWLSTGDENFRERAEQRMRRVVDSTDILILASHTRPLLTANCDRIIWLEHGKIRRDGDAATILNEYFGPELGPTEDVRQEAIRLTEYLASQPGHPCDIVFEEEEQPGGDVVRILSCRLVDASGSVIGSAFTSEEFFLEVTYRLNREGPQPWISCLVNDALGGGLFWCSDVAQTCIRHSPAIGIWVSRLEIPRHLLSPANIRFTIGINDARSGKNYAYLENILPFEITDDVSDVAVRGNYKGKLPGLFRPNLKWTTHQAETPERTPLL